MKAASDRSAVDEAALRAGLILERPGEAAAPVPERTKRVLAEALGPAPPPPRSDGRAAFVPAAVEAGNVFGVALQLYQLRSARNLGIGDLADLRALIGPLANAGVDFVGLNPLHALFTADPERASPFAPSDRRFLNPFIIAVDAVPGYAAAMRAAVTIPAADEQVDYAAAGAAKLHILRQVFAGWADGSVAEADRAEWQRFAEAGGSALADYALFEALSHHMAAAGHGAGTRGWPADCATRAAPGVAAFAAAHRDEIAFHIWLQFLADRQLAETQAMALAAGMRLGLYLDLAVGTAPDGAATWSDPALSMPGVRVGAPPDLFSAAGQDWGLAPLSPTVLMERGSAPYRAVLAAVMRHAGAVRIDHAMGLERLFLIPDGAPATEGAYVRMPGLVDEVVAATHEHRAVAIGEDLGVVPPGFRERMARRRIFSTRILMFERGPHGLVRPARYPRDALACLSTHDFPPLEAWWDGDEIDLRHRLGSIGAVDAAREHADRRAVKTMLLELSGLPPGLAARPLGETAVVAFHRTMARTASRMVVVRLEDVLGGRRIVNLPGTDREHPNWRHTLPVTVDEIIASPLLSRVFAAVREARS